MKYLNYEIFEGRMADISEVCDLNFSIFRNLYAREPFSLEKYLERLSGEDFFIYLIKQDKKIVGDSISFLKGEILYIWILGITEKHRKNGLASKLLELNEKIARKNNCEMVTVKVYDVSIAMIELLKERNYIIASMDKTTEGDKHSVIHFCYKLK